MVARGRGVLQESVVRLIVEKSLEMDVEIKVGI